MTEDTRPLLMDLYGATPPHSGPASEIERLLTAAERLANGPQYYDRMVVLRSLLKQLRQQWDTLREEETDGPQTIAR